MRRDPGDDLRRKIQPVQRSQGPLVILRNLASRNDHSRARVSSARSYVSDPSRTLIVMVGLGGLEPPTSPLSGLLWCYMHSIMGELDWSRHVRNAGRKHAAVHSSPTKISSWL